MMLARMLVYVVVFVVVLLVHSTAAPVKHVNVTYGVDLCTRPSPDPCSPGGKWDPLLNKCQGVGGEDCYQCYSGVHCQEMSVLEDCQIQSLHGNPEVLSEYWTTSSSYNPCLSVPADYRPAYQNTLLPPVEAAIRQLHKTVGNADTDGYTIVHGVGATNVLYMTITALSESIIDKCVKAGRKDCPSTVDVFVQAPFYGAYSNIVGSISTANWNPQANVSSEFTIEIVTHPNNPNGELRKPLVSDRSHVMYDMVYYWPMYTNASVMMTEDLMIFSASKHCGLAGTRFGWGLVKDAKLANSIMGVDFGVLITPPEDSMLRAYNTISSVLKEDPSPASGMLPYHEFGRKKIFTAFSRLSEAMKDCTEIDLLNDIEHSPGAYAWMKCADGVKCLDKVKELTGIEGTSGSGYGATDDYLRFSMFLHSVEMDILIQKMTKLCSAANW